MSNSKESYAAAYLEEGAPLAAAAIPVSQYLGFGSLAGAIDLALQHGRGVYVLALTSNPEGPQFQHARVEDGRMVGQVVVEEASRYNPAGTPGSVGVVVGATIGRTGVDFSTLNGSILAPGIGAQGATAADLAEVFGPATSLVLPSASREVMSAGPDPAALRATALRIRGEMEAVLGVG